MGDTTDIRKGAVIRHNNDLFVVTFAQFVNPGKGAAFTKTKMRGISSGKTMEITYKSGETVDTVQVDYVNTQYLYRNGVFYSFMNQSTYETIDVSENIVGEDGKYLKEGLELVMAMFEGNAVALQLPKKIKYTVKEPASSKRR